METLSVLSINHCCTLLSIAINYNLLGATLFSNCMGMVDGNVIALVLQLYGYGQQ